MEINKKQNGIKSISIVTYGMKKGGTERVISLLASYFSNKNVNVKIHTFMNNGCDYSLEDNVEVIPLTDSIDNKYNNIDIIKRMITLRKQIKKIKPEITLIMPEEISAVAIPTLIGLNTSIVVSERNNPWIMPQNKVKRILRKVFYNRADGFVFQTNQAKTFFNEKIQKNSKVIPNPISSDISKHTYDGIRPKQIVSVGRLENQKNFDLLIDAFYIFKKNNPEYKLTIYGEGTLRNQLQEKINLLNMQDDILLPGKQDDIFDKIKSAEMFVLSSNFEGMPNALMEAMALGIPVISTDCPSGGPSDLIDDGINGLLVPVNDKEAMSNAMNKIATSPELRDKLSNNSKEILQTLNPNNILKTWEEYLTLCIKRK